MEALSQWTFGVDRPTAYYLIGGGILIVLVLRLTRPWWLSVETIVPWVLTGGILYLLFQRTIYRHYSVMEQLNNQLVQINIDKYPDLQTDLNIVRILLDLKPFMRIDRIKYTQFVEEINEFFRVYKTLPHTQYTTHNLYESCYQRSVNALNILTNFVLDSPVYPKLTDNRTVSTEHTFVIPDLKTYSELLQGIFSKYLDEIEQTVNKDWKRGNINTLSSPVYSKQPLPKDPMMEPHYDIF